MTAQFDLFDLSAKPAPARPPAPLRPVPVGLLPRRTVQWERLLATATHTRVEIVVSSLWTGIILEVLSDPQLGRQWLDKDGAIGSFPPDRRYGRTMFMTADQFGKLIFRQSLEQVGERGTASIRYHFAQGSQHG